MIKKYWLIIIIITILVIGGVYWYLNYRLVKIIPPTSIEKTTGIEEKLDENINSIELEKPPFIKD